MPLLMAAPINTPTDATMSIRLNDAAREPTAELRKFTASLLTPTDKSKTASIKRKMITQRNNTSIIFSDYFVCHKVTGKKFHKCFKKLNVL